MGGAESFAAEKTHLITPRLAASPPRSRAAVTSAALQGPARVQGKQSDTRSALMHGSLPRPTLTLSVRRRRQSRRGPDSHRVSRRRCRSQSSHGPGTRRVSRRRHPTSPAGTPCRPSLVPPDCACEPVVMRGSVGRGSPIGVIDLWRAAGRRCGTGVRSSWATELARACTEWPWSAERSLSESPQ
jgi:hypothetical protein